MDQKRRFYSDTSFWFLLVINIFVVFIIIIENWSFAEIIWLYWGQSVAIGIINSVRLIRLRHYSVDNLKINDVPAVKSPSFKYMVAGFFSFHYAFFHFVYAIFLFAFGIAANFSSILFGAGVFFIDHLFSYFYNEKRDSNKKRNIGTIMALPYFRILPMHFIIIFGGWLGFISGQFFEENIFALVLFLFLKIIADLGMHIAEHKNYFFNKSAKNFFN